MPWTYGHDPAESDRDHVRFLVGDTDESDPLLDDREVDWALTSEGTVEGAAVACARGLAAQFSRKATSVTVGRTKRQFENRAQQFRDLADEIESGSSTLTDQVAAAPVAPQTTVSGHEDAAADSDRWPGVFHVGMERNPRV